MWMTISNLENVLYNYLLCKLLQGAIACACGWRMLANETPRCIFSMGIAVTYASLTEPDLVS